MIRSSSTFHTRPKPRVAFVVQRCGAGVNGGAESLCLQVAQQMATQWDMEILTTCAVDYVTWRNHFPGGPEATGSLVIRRFPVAVERDNARFDELSAQLLARQPRSSIAEQEQWMQAQGPCSPELTAYIREHRDEYDAFLFFGYLYATTYDNLPWVADKAWLVPCTHDEWPIHFTLFDRVFAWPRGFVFNTQAERAFTHKRFFHLEIDGPVAGVGIEPPATTDPDGFRSRLGIDGPFLLYCGRIDPSKGCGEMLEAFLTWKQRGDVPHQLVLIGNPVMPIPEHPAIRALGFLPEAEKWNAMAACDWLIMPSRYESLSLVLLEAWAAGRPALVNAACDVLVEHCARGQGGLAFHDWEEACSAVRICSQAETARLGEQGRRYVRSEYLWPEVVAKYASILSASSVNNLVNQLAGAAASRAASSPAITVSLP